MGQADLHEFAVKRGDKGMEICLAGEDITKQLAGLSIDMRTGMPYAEVILYVAPAATVSPVVETLAHVQVGEQTGDQEEIARFLSAIDPAKLESEALTRMGFGGGSLTKNMLDLLAEWSRGD